MNDRLGVGQVLGRYRLERTLGRGGMGQVFEATDLALRRPVAVKVISPLLADDDDFRGRFLREARAMAALDSPHVVQVFHQGEDQGHLFIVTQLVPGGDLGRLLHVRGAQPHHVALELVRQASAGLADVHAAGLVHRDVKPANVLVSGRHPDVRALLADFGVASVPDEGDEPGGGPTTIGGTPAYMAPELHTGMPATPGSDVYSMGCVLWATLTGHPPYSGATDYEIARAHRERPVRQLPGRDPRTTAINRVLRQAMAKDPAVRYADGAALRDALGRAAAVSAQRGTAGRAGRPARSRLALAGALVALGVAGAAWWWEQAPADAGSVSRGALEHQADRWASSLGFDRVASRCDSGLEQEAGRTEHCSLRVDGRKGWARAVVGADGGRPAFEPELPPEVVEQTIRSLLRREGIDGHPVCPGHLRGVPAAQLRCRVAGAAGVAAVRVTVTDVADLRVSFDLLALPSR